MPATITITCPKCKAQLKGPAELGGKRVRCKRCNEAFVIPASTRPDPPTPSRPRPAPPAASPVRPAARPAPPSPKTPAPKTPAPRIPVASQSAPPSEEKPLYTFISDDEALAQIQSFKAKASPGSDFQTIQSQPAGAADRNPYGLEDISLKPRCPHCANEMPSATAVVCLNCGYNTQTRAHIRTKRTYENTPHDRFMWKLPGFLCAAAALGAIGFIVFLWVGLHPLAEQNKSAWWTFFDALWFQIWMSVFCAAAAWFTGQMAYRRLVLEPEPPEFEKESAIET